MKSRVGIQIELNILYSLLSGLSPCAGVRWCFVVQDDTKGRCGGNFMVNVRIFFLPSIFYSPELWRHQRIVPTKQKVMQNIS